MGHEKEASQQCHPADLSLVEPPADPLPPPAPPPSTGNGILRLVASWGATPVDTIVGLTPAGSCRDASKALAGYNHFTHEREAAWWQRGLNAISAISLVGDGVASAGKTIANHGPAIVNAASAAGFIMAMKKGSKAAGSVDDAAKAARGAVAAKRVEAARTLGKEGEIAAGIVKNTQHIDSLSGAAKYRIPDELTEVYVKEVKNVAQLDFNAQIRDSLHHSIEQGKEFILVVRKDTALSQPIANAVIKGWIILEYLP